MRLPDFEKHIQVIFYSLKVSNDIDFLFSHRSAFRLFVSVFYPFINLIFIESMFYITSTFVGYNKDEVLLYFFLGAISFGLNSTLSFNNIERLIDDVNKGNIDLILARPLPHLFYVSTKSLEFVRFIQNFLPSSLVYLYLIDWTNINIEPDNLILGLIVMCSGFICIHCFQFVMALPVFWSGESRSILDFTWVFEYNFGRLIPFEGFDMAPRIIFSTLIPVLIVVGISTSVLIGHSSSIFLTAFSLSVAIVMISIKSFFWNLALKNYTSASS